MAFVSKACDVPVDSGRCYWHKLDMCLRFYHSKTIVNFLKVYFVLTNIHFNLLILAPTSMLVALFINATVNANAVFVETHDTFIPCVFDYRQFVCSKTSVSKYNN